MTRMAKLLVPLTILTGIAAGQGLVTTATKDDWEEINFEFNSAILSDGYPSLLRVAELLNKNPDHKVRLTGHTDWVGSHPYNDKLGQNRASAVKTFLEKYGARPGQVVVDTKGKNSPKVDNKTKEGRFMNRRVEMTVTDGQGRVVGAGGAGDAIKALEALSKKQEECCSMILKRLDKLDEIMAMLRDLKSQNQKLQADVDELKRRPAGSGGAGGAAGAAGAAGVSAASTGGGPVSPAQLEQVADRAAKKAVDELKGSGGGLGSKFQILGINAGPDSTGNITFTGRGRFFSPFNSNVALQAQGEYMYFRDRKEGQFDIGLVNRYKRFQLGGFASFKTVGFRDFQQNGTLGQFAATADYLFKHGKVGLFGTKAFLDNAVVNRAILSRNVTLETYLRVVDQIGGQTTLALGKKAWLEGNLGYLHSRAGNDKPGGTLRFVFPVNKMFALTAEGGFNETMLTSDNNGRATFGIMFGNYTHPREFLTADHPVPVDIPRLRFEVLTRRTRTGNDPPVADAGPDQIGTRAGTIQLDGSRSFDPDGDPITFSWTQIAGPAISLTGADTAKPSFMAAEGQAYSFGLTVKDSLGQQGIARVTITTREAPRVRIVRFSANPPIIRMGDASTLNYSVENAESVTITGVTETLRPDTGNPMVRPAMTTTYLLTARNRVSEDTAAVTVIVERPFPRIIRFTATPATILEGQKSTLSWQTIDADSVEIPNVGSFAPNGSVEVMPAVTTAYTLIARNRNGEATGSTVVTVESGPAPLVVTFAANPMQVVEGDSSTLTWRVENADEVNISEIGNNVGSSGSRQVTPRQTTTYLLTAKNRFKSTTAQATVEVIPRVRIISFTANPTQITAGQPVTYSWQTENAVQVFIDGGLGPRPVNGSLTNAGPTRTQTYTLTAVGRGSTATAQVTVTVNSDACVANDPRPQCQASTPVAVIAGGDIVTSFRELRLSAAASFDPRGEALTYSWRSQDGKGVVVDPTSATPTVQLPQIYFGDFTFEVTVTNASGKSSKASVRVTLVQARPLF